LSYFEILNNMKKVLFILCLILVTLTISAQSGGTGISTDPYWGDISLSPEWSLGTYPGNIVYVGTISNPDLKIIDGGHLTIDAGITVVFTQLTSDLLITGSGQLTALGTGSNKIKFTKAPANGHWGHISFETPGTGDPITGTGLFDYCIVEYGYAATSGTTPDNAGGGLQVNATDVIVDHCLFNNNYSNFGGALTVNAGRNTIIRNSIFKSNSANEAGGALLLWTSSTALVENCIFELNHSTGTSYSLYSGGAVWNLQNSSTIVNCTFVENTSDHAGDAIYSYASSDMHIINCILWGSSAQFSGDITSTTIVTCAFETAKPNEAVNSIIISNVASDHFVNAGASDWTLIFGSPCRDAGSTPSPTVPNDYLGNSRIGPYDIGAYEVQYSRWAGTTSDLWATSSNWASSVDPATGTGDVIIPSGLTNYPTGSASQNFTIGSGKVMILNPGAKATFGTLTNSGTLNLESDATNISSLKVDTYSGNNASVELFLTGGEAGTKNFRWHYISSPVSSLASSAFAPTPTQNLAQYVSNRPSSDALQGWVAYDGYVYFGGGSDPANAFSSLSVGKGYDYYYTADYKFTLTGQLNTSTVNASLAYTSGNDALYGFNLLGNPFSCGLDWSQIIADASFPANTSKGIYFTRDNVQCSYIGGVGVPGDVTAIIPPMQGFFTKTYSSANSINLLASAKVQNGIHSRYKGSEIIPLVRLSLTENSVTDETVVRFDANAKTGLDNDFDALKMFIPATGPAIYSAQSGTNYSINGQPFPDQFVDIPIVVTLGTDGTHKISATQLQGLDSYPVTLIDNTTGFMADLKTTPELTFNSSAGKIADRFVLKIGTIVTGTENPVVSKNIFNIYSGNSLINIQTIADEWEGQTGSVKIFDLTGKPTSDLQNAEFSKNSIIQVPTPATKGLYLVEIRSGIKRYVGKVVVK
jgi:hypothetical protein